MFGSWFVQNQKLLFYYSTIHVWNVGVPLKMADSELIGGFGKTRFTTKARNLTRLFCSDNSMMVIL